MLFLLSCGGGEAPFDPAVGKGPEPAWGTTHVTFAALTAELAGLGIDETTEDQTVRFHPFDDTLALFGYGTPRTWFVLFLDKGTHAAACGDHVLPVAQPGWLMAPFWVEGDELWTLSTGKLTRCRIGTAAEGGGLLEEIAADWDNTVTSYHAGGFTTALGRTTLDGAFTPFDWDEANVLGASQPDPDKSSIQVILASPRTGGGYDVEVYQVEAAPQSPVRLAAAMTPPSASSKLSVVYDWGLIMGSLYFDYDSNRFLAMQGTDLVNPRPVMDGSGVFFTMRDDVRFRKFGSDETRHFDWPRMAWPLEHGTPWGTVIGHAQAVQGEEGTPGKGDGFMRVGIQDLDGKLIFEATPPYPCGDCQTSDAEIHVYQSGICVIARELEGKRPLLDAAEGLSEPLPWVAEGGALHAFDCRTGEGFETHFAGRSLVIDPTMATNFDYFWGPNMPLVSAVYETIDRRVMLASWYVTLEGLVPLHPPAYKIFMPFYRGMAPAVVWTRDGLEAAIP